MRRREAYPPIQKRRPPRLIQKRPGRWYAVFRHKNERRDRLVLVTEPSDTPPQKVTNRLNRVFTQPYLAGTYTPWQEDRTQGTPERAPTINEAKEIFLARYDGSTRRAYESVLRLFEATLEPHTLTYEVEPKHIRAFVFRETALKRTGGETEETERPISRATQKHAWRHLRAFFNWCLREHYIDENPVERVSPPRVEEKQLGFVMPKTFSTIMGAADDLPFANAYRLALGAGLRRNELRYLQAKDVDLDVGLVSVRSKVMEEGEFRPKGRRDRRIPLNALSRSAVEAALETVDSADDLLFREHGGPIEETRLTRQLASILETCGVNLRRPLHALRGHYITYMLLLEWPVPLVQELAGHRDPQTTLGYWRSASGLLFGDARERFREQAEALGFEGYAARERNVNSRT